MNFPPELFLQIIDQIDHPKDLLALGLASRLFAAIIIPDHMDYRQIWCEVDEHPVWDHLLVQEQRSRCRAVRMLAVDNPERHYIPRPAQCQGQQTIKTDLEFSSSSSSSSTSKRRLLLSQQKFCEALSRMSNLKTLRCALSNEDIATNVAHALTRAGCALEELEIEVGRPQYQEPSENAFQLQIISPHLHSISKISIYVQVFVKLDPNSMMQILSDMPNLTHFKLICPTVSLPQLLTIGRWPKLKALTLQASDLREDSEDDRTYATNLRAFFTRHSRLESLNLFGTLVPDCMYEGRDFLPRLTSFRNDYYKTSPIGSILSTSISKNLTHLTIFVSHETFNLKANALVSLKTCNLRCDGDAKLIDNFVEAAPNVEKLCLPVGFRISGSALDLLQRLLPLKKLTTLLGLLNNVSLSDQQGMALLSELYKFTSLSHIYVKVGNERRCAHLLPNHLRKIMDYEILPLSEQRGDEYLDWGDFF